MKKSEHAVADWAKLVQAAQMEQLDENAMRFLGRVVLIEDKLNADEGLRRVLDSGRGGFASVFWNRMKALNIEITPSLAIVVGDSSFNFGVVTMMSAYLKWWCYEHQKNSVSLSDWCTEVFPFGYPSNKTWEKLWDEQKCFDGKTPLSNLLDDRTCYESLNR